MKFGKAWGETRPLLREPFAEVHELKANRGFRSSWHSHTAKGNWFYCLTGELVIETSPKEYELIDATVLKPGEFTTVAPGVSHRFLSYKGATALEGYYPAPLGTDIEREDEGGEI